MYDFSKLLLVSLYLVVTIVTIADNAHAQGYYTIASPGFIRPNSNYTVHVSVANVPSATRIKLSLKGPIVTQFTQIELQPNTARRVTFNLFDIPQGAYTLEAEGLSGLVFKNVSNLEFAKATLLVYIQTDKPMYRPGEVIKFRAIFLNQYLLPAKISQNISVLIKDSQDNKIQSFNNIVLNTGVYKGNLKLAESIVTGEWSLEVFVGQDKVANEIVEVKEYQLPLFEVEVDAPDLVLLSKKKFTATVRAHYTYGKKLSGNCLFRITTKTIVTEPREYILRDGEVNIEVDLKPLNRRIQNIYLNITVLDSATQTQVNASKLVNVVAKLYDIDTPNLKYECDSADESIKYRASVLKFDGSPIDSDEEVLMTFDMGVNAEKSTIVAYADENGYIEEQIECSNYKNINVTLDYKGQKKTGTIEVFHRNNDGPGGVYVKTQYPEVGSQMEVRLVSPEVFSSFACVIVGRGNIVYDNIIRAPNGDSSQAHTFFITPTFDMMPRAHIFVYFFNNGKMIYYETTFSVKKEFQNTITIDTPESVEPGDFVAISVETDPNSYVGLLGMDKSLLLLKSGNDFDAEAILNDLVDKTKLANTGGPGLRVGLVTMTNAPYNREPTDNTKITDHASRRRGKKVRRNFFETFAFQDFTSLEGYETLNEKIPDTITSWVITGFSINPITGLTITTSPTLLRTFMPFFVSVNLPYAVKLGESITLSVVVFNYLQIDTKPTVTMETENEEFEFVGNEIGPKRIFVPKGKTNIAKFRIRPKVTGMITLRISAECPYATDTIIKKLRVEYEGTTVWNNKDFYINGEERKTFKLNIPDNIVKGSEHIEIFVMDFIMGSMLNLINNGENFDNLIHSPTGCGEQNMIHSVPNLMVLKYLQGTGTSNPALYEKARINLQTGYQRELIYKVPGYGCFSTWGALPGITWLTAYVIRIFHEAKTYIFVDDNILKGGLDFLKNKQEPDGSFREDGRLYDFMTLKKLSLTASVLLSFIENTKDRKDSLEYKNAIDKGIAYVKNNVKQSNDLLDVALSLYALQLHGDPMVNELLTILEGKAKTSADHKWWQYSQNPSNMDVYVTGYILLAMIEMKKPITPIVKWLVSKRNNNGGFSSSLETEVGLRALATYAMNFKEISNNLEIDVQSEGQSLQTFKVGEKNKDINQKFSLPKHIRELYFTARGNGKATLQISYNYNTPNNEVNIFNINAVYSDPLAPRKTLEICVQLISLQIEQTQMAVMEVNLPSGDQVAPNCCDRSRSKRIKKIETTRLSQHVKIYFDGFPRDQKECVHITTVKVHNVSDLKPGSVLMYDYYEKDPVDRYYYEIKT